MVEVALFGELTSPKLRELRRRARLFSLLSHQSFPKPAIPLQMPLPAHRFSARVVPFRIQQEPYAATRRPRSRPRIMPRDTSLEIVRPSDVRPIPINAATAKNVYEAFHLSVPRCHCSPLQKGEGPAGEVLQTVRQPPRTSTMFDLKQRHSGEFYGNCQRPQIDLYHRRRIRDGPRDRAPVPRERMVHRRLRRECRRTPRARKGIGRRQLRRAATRRHRQSRLRKGARGVRCCHRRQDGHPL